MFKQSSSEESEEDFAFLDQQIMDTSELDDVSRRMLAGIIQAPPKARKRFDKLTKEEIWDRRRSQRKIDQGSDLDYDDEVDSGIDQMGTIERRDGNDSVDHGVIANLRKKRGKRNNCLLYTSPSPRDVEESRMPSSP